MAQVERLREYWQFHNIMNLEFSGYQEEKTKHRFVNYIDNDFWSEGVEKLWNSNFSSCLVW